MKTISARLLIAASIVLSVSAKSYGVVSIFAPGAGLGMSLAAGAFFGSSIGNLLYSQDSEKGIFAFQTLVAFVLLDETTGQSRVTAINDSVATAAGINAEELNAFNSPKCLGDLTAILNQVVQQGRAENLSAEEMHRRVLDMAGQELSPEAMAAYKKVLIIAAPQVNP